MKASPHAPPLQAQLLAAQAAALALQAQLAACRGCQDCLALRALFTASDAADHITTACSSFGQVRLPPPHMQVTYGTAEA